MSDHHHHNHSHHSSSMKEINRAFSIGIGLNLLFTIIEFIVGWQSQSLALLSDASHNLSDVASLVISVIGMKLAQKAATQLYTYGYKKASILASLINTILLITVVIGIFIEAIERLKSPQEIVGNVIIITALIGVVINGVSAFLFVKGQKDDINIKAAFLHLLVDALVSVGVVIGGIVIKYTQFYMIDTILSLIIGVIILMSTYSILVESLRLTLDGVPHNINSQKIKHLLTSHAQIENVHHIHIWALSSTQNAITVHILPKENYNLEELQELKNELKASLQHHKIHHATIEFDSLQSKCCDITC